MTNLVPFNRKLFGGFDSMFDDLFNVSSAFSNSLTPSQGFAKNFGAFKVDVVDNENEYIIEAEMPGVDKESVTLDYNDGKLLISVSETKEELNEGKNYIHRERRVSQASRSVYLSDASGDDIKAKLDNGILCVTVPKARQEVKAHKIDIE
jgi:HSP20 family protein